MQLIARKAFTYGRKRVRPGDAFEATRKDGKALVAIGRASQGPSGIAQLASMSVELPEQDPPEVVVTTDAEAVTAEAQPEPKPKRAYKRRDLTAES